MTSIGYFSAGQLIRSERLKAASARCHNRSVMTLPPSNLVKSTLIGGILPLLQLHHSHHGILIGMAAALSYGSERALLGRYPTYI